MPHGHTDSTKATAQNAVTEEAAPNDMGREQHASTRAEPRTYAAEKLGDASLAAPAAGEVGDYAELEDDDALGGGAQQGRSNNDRELHAHSRTQGPKTTAANRRSAQGGSADEDEACP